MMTAGIMLILRGKHGKMDATRVGSARQQTLSGSSLRADTAVDHPPRTTAALRPGSIAGGKVRMISAGGLRAAREGGDPVSKCG
jgi:hypothetical protein